MNQTYFIRTFGCASNEADSERIASVLEGRGMKPAKDIYLADHVVINTCVVRESAENRVYGLLNNLEKLKKQMSEIHIRHSRLASPREAWRSGDPESRKGNDWVPHPLGLARGGQVRDDTFKNRMTPKIVVTGCLVGLAARDPSGKLMKRLHEKFPMVDEFLHIEEVGFDNAPLRTDETHAWVPVSNGCNNCCTFCVVPFTRGREVSRPYEEILKECAELLTKNYKLVTLVGQNVNSYGADLVHSSDEFIVHGKKIKPIYVKHLGRLRIPTLFPYLLDDVAKMGFEKVDFISSNPWDFTDELIDVIARNENITRAIHLPVQSGDNEVLKRMNRWYSRDEYLGLISKLKNQISKIQMSTDIIVGFPGESEEQFENTVKLAKEVGFYKAYISEYSDRPMTAAHKIFPDDVPHDEKKRRWKVMETLINKN